MKKKETKKTNISLRKIGKILACIIMLGIIFLLSPVITQNIQHLAKCIYELDENIITRFIELVLVATFIMAINLIGKDIDN